MKWSKGWPQREAEGAADRGAGEESFLEEALPTLSLKNELLPAKGPGIPEQGDGAGERQRPRGLPITPWLLSSSRNAGDSEGPPTTEEWAHFFPPAWLWIGEPADQGAAGSGPATLKPCDLKGENKNHSSLSFPREGTGFWIVVFKVRAPERQRPLGAHQKHKLSGLMAQTGGSRTLSWGPAVCAPGALRCPGQEKNPFATPRVALGPAASAPPRGGADCIWVCKSQDPRGARVQINICKAQSQSWVTAHPAQLWSSSGRSWESHPALLFLIL